MRLSTTVSDIFITFMFINQLSQYPQTALTMLVLWVDIFSICVWLTECKGFIEPTACRCVAHNDSCIDSTAITANVQGNRLSSNAHSRVWSWWRHRCIARQGSWLVERMQRQIMKWRRGRCGAVSSLLSLYWHRSLTLRHLPTSPVFIGSTHFLLRCHLLICFYQLFCCLSLHRICIRCLDLSPVWGANKRARSQ